MGADCDREIAWNRGDDPAQPLKAAVYVYMRQRVEAGIHRVPGLRRGPAVERGDQY